jgi:hypothetical protein
VLCGVHIAQVVYAISDRGVRTKEKREQMNFGKVQGLQATVEHDALDAMQSNISVSWTDHRSKSPDGKERPANARQAPADSFLVRASSFRPAYQCRECSSRAGLAISAAS